MVSLNDVYAHLNRFVEAGELPGAAIAIARHGEVIGVWHGGHARPGVPVTAHTLWPVASISKTYTAAAVMALVERGVLTLNTRAAELFPQFTGGGREHITLRHLLTHTAGMIYESPDMEQRLRDHVPLRALFDEALAAPLAFAPGEWHSYADFNYLVAAMMAERASGVDFHELVRVHVLEPARLKHTFMPPPPGRYDEIAISKGAMAEGSDGQMYGSPHAWSLGHPAFGTVATVVDLLKFGLCFMGGGRGFLSPATVRAMTTDQTNGRTLGQHPAAPGAPSLPVPWGLGFYIQSPTTPGVFGDLAAPGSFGHGGASGCQWVMDPVNGISAALVSNLHARTGRERWGHRLRSTLNLVWAAA